MMYDSISQKFTDLPNDAIIYPAHGAGSLCGNNMSDAKSSTLGEERKENWAFQEQTKEEFINHLLNNQPFIPSYFSYNVAINKEGAEHLRKAFANVDFHLNANSTNLIVDVREEKAFKENHIKGSYNIQANSENAKFETWLGAIVKPKESFDIVIEKRQDVDKILHRVSKIGYEKQLQKIITLPNQQLKNLPNLDIHKFKNNLEEYTIVDIRNQSEIDNNKIFAEALEHPLNDLRATAKEIPTNKPIVVHCAGGYRSAAGSSIIKQRLPKATIYDLSDAVKKFQ